jgi:hypothetical protein
MADVRDMIAAPAAVFGALLLAAAGWWIGLADEIAPG